MAKEVISTMKTDYIIEQAIFIWVEQSGYLT